MAAVISVMRPQPGSTPTLDPQAPGNFVVTGTLPVQQNLIASMQVWATSSNAQVQGHPVNPSPGLAWQFDVPDTLFGPGHVVVRIPDPNNGDTSIVIPVTFPAFHKPPRPDLMEGLRSLPHPHKGPRRNNRWRKWDIHGCFSQKQP